MSIVDVRNWNGYKPKCLADCQVEHIPFSVAHYETTTAEDGAKVFFYQMLHGEITPDGLKVHHRVRNREVPVFSLDDEADVSPMSSDRPKCSTARDAAAQHLPVFDDKGRYTPVRELLRMRVL